MCNLQRKAGKNFREMKCDPSQLKLENSLIFKFYYFDPLTTSRWQKICKPIKILKSTV